KVAREAVAFRGSMEIVQVGDDLGFSEAVITCERQVVVVPDQDGFAVARLVGRAGMERVVSPNRAGRQVRMKAMLKRSNMDFVQLPRQVPVVRLMRLRIRRRVKRVHRLRDRRDRQLLNERAQRGVLVLAEVSGLLQAIEFVERHTIDRRAVVTANKNWVCIWSNGPPTGVGDYRSYDPGESV